VGRRFLNLLATQRDLLLERFQIEWLVVGVADSGGTAYAPDGLDPQAIIDLKEQGQSASALPGTGQPGQPALDLVRRAEADVLVELSPTNFEHGQPGLACIEAALKRGWHVVTANKGPLVLAYRRLMELARQQGCQLRFSATAGGGLPTVNLGQRDLAGSRIERIEACINATTTYILARMGDGLSFTEALAEAQARGSAEADPSLDVDGWDLANKLVILANAVLDVPISLADVQVTAIRGVTADEIRAARAEGTIVRLVARAERRDEGWQFTVAPQRLPADHPLGRLGAHEMGIVYHTDVAGRLVAIIEERGPVPTAAAVLRDVIAVASDR
jgi:homoserine dehydrogenase